MYRFRTFAILAVFAILTAIGCDGRGATTAPDGPVGVAPQFGKGNDGRSGSNIVWGEDGDGYGEAVIAPEGGTLAVGEHRLTVPQGAVVGPTLFTMELTGATSISVELTATALGSVHKNDVGGRGFKKTLNLDLSYDRARGYALNQMHIAFVAEDGSLQAIPSHVFRAQKFVRGHVDHFSGYIIAD